MAKRGQGEGSIYKRDDGRWAATLSLGYQGGKRRRKTYYGKTRREVQEQLTAALAAQQQGILASGERQTVEQYLLKWLETARQSLRPRAYEAYELNVRRVLPFLGTIRLVTLSPAAIQQCYAALLERGPKGRPLSRRSVEQCHTVLHRALRQALQWELIYRNPTEAVSVPRPQRREMKTLTAEQVGALFASSAGDPFHALWVLFATAGLRMGEATALRWADLDLKKGTIIVQRAVQRQRGAGITFVEPKSDASRRTIDLAPVTISALADHRQRQGVTRAESGPLWQDYDLIFCTGIGTPLDPAHVRRAFHRTLDRAGLPQLRPHDLRHTCATLLMEDGERPRVVQELLGHSTITLTLGTYSHVSPTMRAGIADRMERLFGSSIERSATVRQRHDK